MSVIPLNQRLEAVPFDASLIGALGTFDCGSEIWAQAATQWIANPLEFNGALKSIRDHQTQVWLFYLHGMIVGFGGIGPTPAPWRAPDAHHKEIIGYIPQLAVDKDFHGQPAGEKNGRFCRQILGHLFAVAKERSYNYVGIRVDSENQRGLSFYRSAGFVEVYDPAMQYGRLFHRLIAKI